MPGGQINERNDAQSSCPPSNFLVSVSCVASGTTEKQGHRQVWRARHGGPRTLSKTIDAKLDCAFVENALFYTLIVKGHENRVELMTRPGRFQPLELCVPASHILSIASRRRGGLLEALICPKWPTMTKWRKKVWSPVGWPRQSKR